MYEEAPVFRLGPRVQYDLNEATGGLPTWISIWFPSSTKAANAAVATRPAAARPGAAAAVVGRGGVAGSFSGDFGDSGGSSE